VFVPTAHLAHYFQWTEEEALNNFRKDPINIQQKIADKCCNLNKRK